MGEGGDAFARSRRNLGVGPAVGGLLVVAIRVGLLTVMEADAAKAVLERHRFKLAFASFRDVL